MSKVNAAPAASDGDGSGQGQAVMETPAVAPAIPDASPDQATLDSHVDEVLGITKAEVKTDGASGADKGSVEPEPAAGEPKPADEAGEAEPKPTEPEPTKPEPEPKPEPKEPVAASVAANDLTLVVKDADGKEFTLKPGDDIDVVLKDFNPTGTGQVLKVIQQVQELEARAKVARQQEADTQTEQAKQAEQAEVLKGWDGEIEGLHSSGRMPKPAVAASDPKYLEDPAVKRVDQVFKYMTTENQRRSQAAAKVGQKPLLIRSFVDALDKLELQEMRATAAKAKDDETKVAQAKSNLIGGGTAGGGAPATPVYRPGQAHSIWDL